MDYKPKIVINGQEVDITNLPEQFRGMLKDENQNGIPDMVEGMLAQLQKVNPSAMQAMQQFFVNGKVFDGLDKLPPEVKARIQEKLAAIPNLGVFGQGTPSSGAPAQWPTPTVQAAPLSSPSYPNIGVNYANPAAPKSGMFYVALIAITGILVFGGLIFYYLWRKGIF